jgi:hypothetical protein
MPIVLLNHPRIGMAQVLSDYKQGYAIHGGEACPRVAQCMKVEWRFDFGASARLCHRPQLMTLAPHRAVGFKEHWLATRAVDANLLEEGRTVIGQHDMARFAGLTDADRDSAVVSIEVIHRKPNELAIAGTCFERGTNEIPK